MLTKEEIREKILKLKPAPTFRVKTATEQQLVCREIETIRYSGKLPGAVTTRRSKHGGWIVGALEDK